MDNYITTQYISEYAGEVACWLLQSGDNLKSYMRILPYVADYSVNNQLAVLGYKPDAVMLKSSEDWMALGASVRQDATQIPIIEPDVSPAGEPTGTYHVKILVDVSDTNYPYQPVMTDNLMALEALLTNRDVDIRVVDDIKQNVRAMYVPKENVILVKRSAQAPPAEFFTAIAAEMVHANLASNMEGTYPRGANLLTAMTTTFALANKYGVANDNIDFSNLPEKYTKLDAKNAKKELGKISTQFSGIDKKMQEALRTIQNREAAYERTA